MDFLTKLQVINGVIWFFLGILIVVWLIIPTDLITFILWAGFAVGCILTGICMVAEPFITKKQ